MNKNWVVLKEGKNSR